MFLRTSVVYHKSIERTKIIAMTRVHVFNKLSMRKSCIGAKMGLSRSLSSAGKCYLEKLNCDRTALQSKKSKIFGHFKNNLK